jgi:hypothetical protein
MHPQPHQIADCAFFTVIAKLDLTGRLAFGVKLGRLVDMTKSLSRYEQRILQILRSLVWGAGLTTTAVDPPVTLLEAIAGVWVAHRSFLL